MGKDKKSFRDDLEKLAEVTNIIDETCLSKGDVKVIVELEEKEYRKVISSFGDVYRNLEEIIIDISNVKFTFVLKK
jgi:hypothetical protein